MRLTNLSIRNFSGVQRQNLSLYIYINYIDASVRPTVRPPVCPPACLPPARLPACMPACLPACLWFCPAALLRVCSKNVQLIASVIPDPGVDFPGAPAVCTAYFFTLPTDHCRLPLLFVFDRGSASHRARALLHRRCAPREPCALSAHEFFIFIAIYRRCGART
eukprot:SAG11_NODE_3875_length_2177_cov_1.218479_2_plen_164_part_00